MAVLEHVAIIMDGNGRWARQNKLPRQEGHKRGVNSLKEIIKETESLEINCLTVYAFSTENWQRPRREIEFLMKLFQNTLQKQANELAEKGIKVKIIGRRRNLPDYLVKEIVRIEKMTANNEKLTLNIAFNYGGRAEIVDAVKKIVADDKQAVRNLTPEKFSQYLYNPDFSEVEFLIRTGGEQRVSNFLLWEIAYAELYITKKYWPEFTARDFREAINEFKKRKRRFGKIVEGEK